MKRTAIILGIIVLAAGIMVLGYALRTKQAINIPSVISHLPQLGGGSSTPSSSGSSSLGPHTVSNDLVLGAAPLIGGGAIFVSAEGKVLQTDGKTVTPLSSSSIPNALSASFSYDAKRILVNSTGNTYWLFNVDKKTWQMLSLTMGSPAWSPKTHDIAYETSQSGKTALQMLSVDKYPFRPRTLGLFSFLDTRLYWPSYSSLVIQELGSAEIKSSTWSLDWSTGAMTPLIFEQRGVAPLTFEKNGNRAIALTGNGRGGTLMLIDLKGNGIQTFNFLTTPSKCSFSGESLFCGIPEASSFSRLALPDDYLKGGEGTSDTFLKINLQNGEVKTLAENTGIDSSNITASDGNLYVINRNDQKMYVTQF